MTRGLAVLIAALVAAIPAAAAGKAVTIAKSGFVPANVSVAPGDSVTWTNSDTVVHQVSFDKAPCNLVIQPGQQGSCTFSQAGTFNYRDPSQRGSFRGSVSVEGGSASLSLAAAKQTVVFGSAVNLSGTLANQAAGEAITILGQKFGASAFTPIGTATTATGGVYVYAVRPGIETSYQARWTGGSSPTVKVQVRPRVGMAVVNARLGVFTARVSQQRAPVGKIVDVQRRNSFGQWVTVKRVTLKSIGSTTTAGAKFGVKLRSGASSLRVLMPKTQAGPGYLLGVSPVRTVKR